MKIKEYFYKQCTDEDDWCVCVGRPIQDILMDLDIKDKTIMELTMANAQLRFKLDKVNKK